jgi:Flp pilus assembly protein TadG
MKHQHADERGVEIVEFAVVLPVLMLLALIVAEGANLLRVYQIVNNGAREGARVSVLAQDYYSAVNSAKGTALTNPQTCTFTSSSATSPDPVCQTVANYIRNNNVVGGDPTQCTTLTVVVNQTFAPASDSGNPHYSNVTVTCAYTLHYLPKLPFYSIVSGVNVRRTVVFANLYSV